MQKRNILIIDDHKMFLDGIQSLFFNSEQFHLKIINNYTDEHQKITFDKMDLVLLDINMPDINGIELAKKLKKNYSHLKLIFLTSHSTTSIVRKALKANPDGYLLKNTDKIELNNAIIKILEGEKYYSTLIHEIKNSDLNDSTIELSNREKEVLYLISEEKTTVEIAEKLFVSVNTIETHRKNLIRKTGVKNAVGLVKFAINMGLI